MAMATAAAAAERQQSNERSTVDRLRWYEQAVLHGQRASGCSPVVASPGHFARTLFAVKQKLVSCRWIHARARLSVVLSFSLPFGHGARGTRQEIEIGKSHGFDFSDMLFLSRTFSEWNGKMHRHTRLPAKAPGQILTHVAPVVINR